MASFFAPSSFQAESSLDTQSGSDDITNGTLPFLYHHPHHEVGSGSISLAGVLVGILLPHAVCTLFVLARVWSRGVLLRKWFHDDSLVIAAWLCSTGVCVVYSMSAVQRESETERGFTSNHLEAYLLRTYLGLIFYQLCLCLTKLSILSLYLRMFGAVYASSASHTSTYFSPPNAPLAASRNSSSTLNFRRHLRERRLAWLTVIVVIAYGIPLLWMSVMQCYPSSSPARFFGNPVAVCFSFTPLLVSSASLHTATDAWLIVLVVPFVFTRLRFLPRTQRWALAGVLSLSIFVIAASLTRLQLSLHANYRPQPATEDGLQQQKQQQQQQTSHSRDSGPDRANTFGFFIMTILECDIALICASAPTLRPLLARLAPRLGLGDDNGPFDPPRHDRRSIFHPRVSLYNLRHHDDDSEDLTSVVSYHGYPWTRSHTPVRSRSKTDINDSIDTTTATATSGPLNETGSSSSHATAVASEPQVTKPMPVFAKHSVLHYKYTPTDLSLRRPQSTGYGSAKHVRATSPLDDESHSVRSGIPSRRPSSTFFDNSDYDQFFSAPLDEHGSKESSTPDSMTKRPGHTADTATSGSGKKKAGVPGAGIGLGILLPPRHSNGSQESFVMGLNDPASPRRLTRLTGISGYSGETYTDSVSAEEGDDHPLKTLKHKSVDYDGDYEEYELTLLERPPHKTESTESSFLDDDTDSEDAVPEATSTMTTTHAQAEQQHQEMP